MIQPVTTPVSDRQAPGLLARLGLRGQLYASFAAVSLLLTAAAIGAVAWTHHSDRASSDGLMVADAALRETETLRLQMISMSNAMRGYLIDPEAADELSRKQAADAAMDATLKALGERLAAWPALAAAVDAISTFDEKQLNPLENQTMDLIKADRVAASALYRSTYMPMRLQVWNMVDDLVTKVAAHRNAVSEALNAAQQTQLYAGLAALALLTMITTLTAWRLGDSIARPIVGISGVLDRLARQDLTVAIGGAGRGDEIGRIAGATAALRDSLVLASQHAREQAAEQQEKIARAGRLADLMQAFETGVGNLVERLSTAAAGMTTTAQSLSQTAGRTRGQAEAVTGAAQEAGTSVQMVAAAAEELTASIGEINRQITESSRITVQAVADARDADAIVQTLSGGAQKIGSVLELISRIAGQTNLLALNATIEAARAGDAGKGFAVVASEVKNLANQTARATEEIGSQIQQVQNATTQAVAAIRAITGTIDNLSTIAGSIASAVQQQSAAADEIARNVQQTASGTQQVTANIAGVRASVAETDAAAALMLTAAGEVSGQASHLANEVGRFAQSVHAA